MFEKLDKDVYGQKRLLPISVNTGYVIPVRKREMSHLLRWNGYSPPKKATRRYKRLLAADQSNKK